MNAMEEKFGNSARSCILKQVFIFIGYKGILQEWSEHHRASTGVKNLLDGPEVRVHVPGPEEAQHPLQLPGEDRGSDGQAAAADDDDDCVQLLRCLPALRHLVKQLVTFLKFQPVILSSRARKTFFILQLVEKKKY